MPYNNESLPRPTDMPATMAMPAEGADQQFSRRAMIGVASRLVVGVIIVAAGVGLDTEPAHANAAPPTNPPDPLTPEERAKLAAAEADELEAKAALERKQQDQIADSLDKPWYERVASAIGTFVGPVGVIGGIVGGTVTVRKHFAEKAKEQKARQAELEAKEEATRVQEDENFRDANNVIREALKGIGKNLQSDTVNPYEELHLAYLQLEAFAVHERFATRVFRVATTLLRSRTEAYQTKERINVDRELYERLCDTAPQLPRKDTDGETALPNASGISLEGMNYLRRPLAEVNLEGAWLRGLTITGSLRRSRFKLARFRGTTFGEPDAVCDLRGADFSEAELDGADFAHVMISADTRFGAGQIGDPCATFGNVTSDDTLKPEQVQEKIEAAQAVIKAWQQEHPNAENRTEVGAGQPVLTFLRNILRKTIKGSPLLINQDHLALTPPSSLGHDADFRARSRA